mmetsp:Transcript_12044/g.18495  ORF Transcript_12044/g.18495 Transcript_12044/m.18495 type:complete len:224 (-) Transcript_12044:1018-1689(-)|eukprot:CAMPEP_0201732122 /NCGR_PEP_ID=MMETSP0593-20130828/27966_1 /ASSEMBLY_ACC=CAM_ASM_000672 /TAXON_ID=267983 /ORGANISM="Skeletonema japonicum, Strain CCMP2506" /LENGTH=223 /DNA_ID=CAMNT_0048225043 /DNA_START=17 /DNA_END=688 /DNA_ORIENTATION=+
MTLASSSPLAMVSSSKAPLSKNSAAIPFLKRPPQLQNQYAGDVGFDPFNFSSSSPEQLTYYREAEVKHARLAMLAAVGWPSSELFDQPITKFIDAQWSLDLSPMLNENDRVPSLLNGGLDNISPIFWGVCLGLSAAIDLRGVQNARYKTQFNEADGESYLPGDYGFDPLGLYPSDVEGQRRMQLCEIKHGRLAMLAVTGFAFQEYVSKVGVVDETPFLFHPLF